MQIGRTVVFKGKKGKVVDLFEVMTSWGNISMCTIHFDKTERSLPVRYVESIQPSRVRRKKRI